LKILRNGYCLLVIALVIGQWLLGVGGASANSQSPIADSTNHHQYAFTNSCQLPAALDDARDLTAERQLTKAQAAQAKLPEIRPRPAALAAPVAVPHGVLRCLLQIFDALRCRRHRRPLSGLARKPTPQAPGVVPNSP
jgi:hypothetical protein